MRSAGFGSDPREFNDRGLPKYGQDISDDEIDKNLKEKFPLLSFEKGLVHKVALQKLKINELSSSVAYLAGPPPLVNACIKMFLLEFKFKSNRIFFDKFS